MELSDRISELRRGRGMSQEALAEKLGVTRQSVSKWESGASTPDLDKIVKLSELFGVSCDCLLRPAVEPASAAAVETPGESRAARCVSMGEAVEFMELTASVARKIAAAVALLIISPAPMIVLAGLSDGGFGISEGAASGIGVTALLLIAAAAVAALIIYGSRLSKYEFLRTEPIRLAEGVEREVYGRRESYERSYHTSVAVGVALCIMSAIPLVIGGVLELSDIVLVSFVALLLVMVAAAVYLFIRMGSVWSGYNRLLQTEDYTPEEKAIEKRSSPFSGIYWLTITAVYLGVSFYSGDWSRSWIIWPVAGVLFAALYSIVRAIVKSKKS